LSEQLGKWLDVALGIFNWKLPDISPLL